MKLYEVTVEREVVICVLAENQREAERLAENSADEEAENQAADNIAMRTKVIESPDKIPDEWRGAIPYGGDGNTPTHKLDIWATPKTKEG